MRAYDSIKVDKIYNVYYVMSVPLLMSVVEWLIFCEITSTLSKLEIVITCPYFK